MNIKDLRCQKHPQAVLATETRDDENCVICGICGTVLAFEAVQSLPKDDKAIAQGPALIRRRGESEEAYLSLIGELEAAHGQLVKLMQTPEGRAMMNAASVWTAIDWLGFATLGERNRSPVFSMVRVVESNSKPPSGADSSDRATRRREEPSA